MEESMNHEFDRPRRKAVALDPHPLCHTALSTLLARFNIDLVGAATSTRTALALLEEHRPDLLVMEIDLPEGLEAALGIISGGRERSQELTVIVLSGTDDRAVIDAAFDCGASAYVLKTSDPEAIATAIRQAFEPSLYLARPKERTVPATDKDVLRKLTRRELEILQLVSGGRSNRQVAEILWVADQTVKFHLANIYRKLGVRSRFEAARWARESGILDVVVEADPGIAMSEGNGNGGVTRALVPLRSPQSRSRNPRGRLEETSR
jgi:DNA-binding NarL/FixJ family response regulator